MSRVVRKIIFSLLILFGVLLISGVIITRFYKDSLVRHLVTEINKSLNTPVNVEKIDMSIFHHFPRVSFRFHKIDIKDSFPGNDSTLLNAEILDLSFNPWDAAFGDLVIDRVYLENASVFLRMDKNGDINYRIFKAPDSTAQKEPVKINLAGIQLKNARFRYDNAYREMYLDFNSPDMAASIIAEGRQYDIIASGEVITQEIETGGKSYTWDFPVHVESTIAYNDSLKHVDIKPSVLSLFGSDFNVFGEYIFLDGSTVDLTASSETANIETLLALLQTDFAAKLKDYSSTGDVYLTMNLTGEWLENKGPGLKVDFGLKNADILHQPSGIKMNGTFLTGQFSAPDIAAEKTYLLSLRDVNGTLGDQKFSGSLYVKNPDNPWVSCRFDGRLDLAQLLEFMPVEGIHSGRGMAKATIAFDGLLGNLKQKRALSSIKTSGEFTLESVYLEFTEIKTGLRNVNGNLLFNNNDLALNNVSGNFGRSDFLLNGNFKNVIAYLLFEEEPVGIESSLKSRRIDMDELLSLREATNDEPYSFTISNRLRLNFDCEIDQLDFRRFHPKNIKGDLKVKNNVAFTDRLELNAMGGDLAIYGMVDASKDKLVRVSTHFDGKQISIDSIFYVFENFNQDFLVDDHLEGTINASIDAEMIFSDRLKLYSETLSAHSSFAIKDGELNDFEPMQRLSKYLDERKLEHLRFSELRNEVVIKDNTIFLPQMEIGTNVTDIRISGTHTFDQKISYNVVAPLRSKPKYDTDRSFGAIREDTQGRSMLYLKILGTTSDYEVLYDQEKVKEKIANDIKKEATELKEVFKNKGEKAETPVLSEDDYFEWEDEGDQ